jgi:hypothetical protein
MQASFLPDVRRSLLELHKALVEAERRGHEKSLGRLRDGEFLDALIKDPAFAWLAPLTALIVRLDEEEGPRGEELARVVRSLVSPKTPTIEFHRRYADLLQRDADVVVAHGALMRTLKKPA